MALLPTNSNTNTTPASRIGGKGSIRRKVKRVAGQQAFDEKRLADGLRRLGVHAIPHSASATIGSGAEQLSFRSPQVSASLQSGVLVISGSPETQPAGEAEPQTTAPEEITTAAREVQKLSKAGKKARKALAGLGNKQGEFQRARVDTHSGLSMRIESAEVSKLVTGSKGDPTFVVLGKIVAQDLAERANAQVLTDSALLWTPAWWTY
eukprot:TRINITY_DN7295_c0_g1_i2.p1 TRINITY_DN7295_c0_g1~~TRINITY_DN7295_c0_g1_i2.p1  ORF type:complete len:208 (+),score=42.40 TRINITY_DN7295_c0_g1_i2:40-663(+)